MTMYHIAAVPTYDIADVGSGATSVPGRDDPEYKLRGEDDF